jgi:hypothetical protein
MARAAITAGQAAQDAIDFTVRSWRDAWAVQTLFAAGLAMAFVGLRGRLDPADAGDLSTIGWATTLMLTGPLVAALLRLRIGGSALRGLGPGGLQLGLAELRLLVIGVAGAGAALLAWLPVVAVSAVVFIAFRPAGMAELPLLGPIRVSFLVAAGVWLAALAGFFYVAARMALALPATVGKRRLVLLEAWSLAEGQAGALVGGLLLTGLPLLALGAATLFLDRLAVQDPSWGAMRTWQLPDSIMAGAVLGAVVAFVQLPLSVGALGAVYCAQRARRMERTRVPHRVHSLLRAVPG